MKKKEKIDSEKYIRLYDHHSNEVRRNCILQIFIFTLDILTLLLQVAILDTVVNDLISTLFALVM